MVSRGLQYHADDLLDMLLQVFAPPPPPKRLSEITRTLRITEGPKGPRPEQPDGDLLDPDWHPGQRAALRLFASGKYRVIIVLSVPQDGKDTGICAPIAIWSINELRRPVAYCTTDLRLVGKLFRAKIRPTMIKSGYAHLLPDQGLGSSGGTPDEILFTNGTRMYLLGAGAANGAGQAGVTVWAVIITEADKIRGKQREWLRDRNKAYAEERVALLIGTLDHNGEGGLWTLYNDSTMGRMHHPCRHCGAWQPLEPEQITYDPTDADTARATARIICRAKQCEWTEDDRRWSVAHSVEVYQGQRIEGRGVNGDNSGRVVGEARPAEDAGLRIWAMDTPMRSLPEHAAEHRRVNDIYKRTGDYDALETFTRAEEVRPYKNKEKTIEVRETDLAIRSADAFLKRGQMPDEGDIITVGVDQQLRRLLFVVISYKIKDAQWHIIDYGFKGICPEGEQPTDDQFFAAMDHVAARVLAGYPKSSGVLFKPMMGGIDTADGNTRERALKWIRNHPGWHAIRGEGGDHDTSDAAGEAFFRLPGVLTIYNQTKSIPHWNQIAFAVDILKGEVLRDLQRQPGSPGAGHIPHGEGDKEDLIMQLCAERQEEIKGVVRWVQRRRHNHYFDCTVYAKGAAKMCAHLILQNQGNGSTTATDYLNQMNQG